MMTSVWVLFTLINHVPKSSKIQFFGRLIKHEALTLLARGTQQAEVVK
jgi:hypothetical protein